jgi:hypothetical protein
MDEHKFAERLAVCEEDLGEYRTEGMALFNIAELWNEQISQEQENLLNRKVDLLFEGHMSIRSDGTIGNFGVATSLYDQAASFIKDEINFSWNQKVTDELYIYLSRAEAAHDAMKSNASGKRKEASSSSSSAAETSSKRPAVTRSASSASSSSAAKMSSKRPAVKRSKSSP